MRTIRRAAAVALVTVLAGLAGAGAAAAQEPPPALSSAQKQALMLDVLERFVPFAESFWGPSDLSEPRTGFWRASGPGVTQPRGAGNVAIAYATLLTARPDQPAFGGVDRAVLLDHTIQAIRHEALTNRLSGAGYERWGDGTWQASLELYGWGYAARLLWDELDAGTRALVERVVTAEADVLLTKQIESGTSGNTAGEDAAWNSPTPALAAVMFPDHPHRAAWEERAKRLALNANSRAADEQDHRLVDGVPLSEWIESVNVNPDLTMVNHGFFNPIYQQVVHVNIGEAAMIYGQAGHPVPEAFSFRTEEVWERILGPIAADDGDLIMTAGQDWTSKDYQHLHYLSTLATRFGRTDAAMLESRALELVARRQATHANGSILGQPRLGYESMVIKRMTGAWWNHELFGPAPQPTAAEFEAARAATGGVHASEYVDVIQARQRDGFASMSWAGAQTMGLVVPSARGHEEDPILVAYTPRSLIGSAAGAIGPYACDCRDDFFSTAGTIGDRRFSMTAFPDGTTILLDRGTGSTFNLGFERIPGLTGERPVYSASGTGLGDLSGRWANVADRIGMVVAGGGGLRARDVDAANPYRLLEGSATTGSGNRGALVLPLADRAQTAAVEPSVVQPGVPPEWSAVYGRATDGSGRIAVARWGGPEAAELVLADERGAPLTSRPAALEDGSATASWSLAAPASTGEEVRFFVAAPAPLRGRALAADRAELVNPGSEAVRARVTYVGASGEELTAERVLLAGERVELLVDAGRLIAAGPEYQPLREAQDRIAALREAIDGWEADGTLSRSEAAGLAGAADRVARAIERALAAATAVRPDTVRAAAAAELARRHVERLGDGAPAAVRERVAADRTAVAALLDRALADGLAVTVRLAADGPALPGEPLTLTATLINRGQGAATGGRLRIEAPAGWAVTPREADVATLAPGATRVVAVELTAAPDAAVGGTVTLRAVLDHTARGERRSAAAALDVPVRPLVTLAATARELPLARGGYNRAEVGVTNHASRPLELTVAADTAPGVSAEPAERALTLAPGATERVAFELRNAGPDGGTSALTVTAGVAGRGGGAAIELTLHHSRNLALNPVGAPWPAASATGSQAAYPPALATDGDPGTFWVSDGVGPGEDRPSPETPKYLAVDLGAPVTVAGVTMVPRVRYGPRIYTIEVSGDGEAWSQIASVPAAANGTVTTTFAPVEARHLRLRITAGWDRAPGQSRNIQVAELEVSAPPG